MLAAILSLSALCYLVYAYASISSLSVKTAGFWIWKRASKFRASAFFFSLLPLIFSLCLSIGGVFGFSVFRFLSFGPIPPLRIFLGSSRHLPHQVRDAKKFYKYLFIAFGKTFFFPFRVCLLYLLFFPRTFRVEEVDRWKTRASQTLNRKKKKNTC